MPKKTSSISSLFLQPSDYGSRHQTALKSLKKYIDKSHKKVKKTKSQKREESAMMAHEKKGGRRKTKKNRKHRK